MLEAVGLTDLEASIYRLLLRSAGLTLAEITTAIGAGRDVARAVARLEELGLVTRETGLPVRLHPVAPDAALGELVRARETSLRDEQATLDQVRHQMAVLQHEYLSGLQARNPLEMVEMVVGADAVQTRYKQLQERARSCVLSQLGVPAVPADSRPVNETQFRAMARGVLYRAVYSQQRLTDAAEAARVQLYVDAGEQARVSVDPEPPVLLAIFDDESALVPLVAGELDRAVVVHRSTLLTALLRLFRYAWDAAIPLAASGPAHGERTPEERRIIMLLAAGFKDEAIARQLKVSVTTVRRRISELMEELGASTRFQAGLKARDLGWL